ncbi:hypothetical protein PQ455_18790 [Sphingomonas naphthae]|uniref:Uncharacterized protein n=1 Tax=Sphingomonas naphthae TaxID=1813468 RepID=A0ABY7TKY6_9SPHN|nr:hypothetical protein [Sphingomonas naphthae]WCT73628.1 hypothetical protein PQ455_18790 [Sphingomonas naphthae]
MALEPVTPVVATPSSIVTEQVVAYGAVGSAPTAVDPTHPLPVADCPYRGATAMTIGAEQTPGRAILIDCSVAGRVALKLADDTTLTVPAGAGLAILPFAVKAVLASGTTATASYASLA